MLKDYEAIIFDLDGTLIDSMGIWRQIDIDFLKERNIPFPEDLQQSLEGMCFKDAATYFIERFNLPESNDELQNIWNDMAHRKYSETPIKEGVKDFLLKAKENGCKLGIATSNSTRLTEAVLKANNVFDMFDSILTGCDTRKSKPDPEVYLEAASLLKVDPEKCLVFEDVIPGILAGKNAGMKVCGVDDVNSAYCESEKIKLSDYYIYSYKELLNGEVLI